MHCPKLIGRKIFKLLLRFERQAFTLPGVRIARKQRSSWSCRDLTGCVACLHRGFWVKSGEIYACHSGTVFGVWQTAAITAG